jgi:hypothetical protein
MIYRKGKAAETSSSEEEESSEDEAVTPSTPKPKYELEEFLLAKFGKHLYLGKVCPVAYIVYTHTQIH